jgi:hypothetical protein
MSAEELFAEDTGAANLPVVDVGSEIRDGATVRDVAYAGSRGDAVPAWIVAPEGGAARAGVLFLHWRGEFDSDRDEFLDEAVELAVDGVASMLIDQAFPFTLNATGLPADRLEIGYQVRDARRALTILASEVGDVPLAVVGHDFGGMYAAILRGVEPRLRAVVIMAATTTWANWFVDFVNVVPADEAPAYRAVLEDIDPITWIAAPAPSPALLQFASFDIYVPRSTAEGFTAAAGDLAAARYYDEGHALGDLARADRGAWLLEAFGID